jgi:hypothetical protein
MGASAIVRDMRWRPNLTVLALATVLAGTFPRAYADDAAILSKLRACTAESDNLRRLACYDAELRPPAAQPPPDAQFGLEDQLARQASQANHLHQLTSVVTAVTPQGSGKSLVRLENRQLWEVLEDAESVDLRPGIVVTVRAGALGAYYLAVKNVSVRVKRLQ